MNNIINTIIVDDDKEFCDILNTFLSEQGDFFVSGICHDGREALNLIAENSPHLVILDIIMPEIDGLGVLEILDTLNITRPKIVILSALGKDNIIRRAFTLGADYYLVKPLDLNQLINNIRQLINDNDCEDNDDNTESLSCADTARDDKALDDEELSLQAQITAILLDIGIPTNVKGYEFLKDAINLVVNDVSFVHSLSRKIYPEIAKIHNTIAPKVGWAIQHAIEVAWSRNAEKSFKGLFKSKPANGEFIALIADKLRLSNYVNSSFLSENEY